MSVLCGTEPTPANTAATVGFGTYSIDELRVLARLCVAPLPPALDPAWSELDVPVADVVATRSLLARGAVLLDDGAADWLRPTDAVRRLFEPVRLARTVVDIERATTVAGQRWVLAGNPLATSVFAEREPDIWQVRLLDRALAEVATGLLGDVLDTLTSDADGAAFDLPPASAAAPGRAPTVDRFGQPALRSGDVRYRVQVASEIGPQRYALTELCWLTGADGARWRLATSADDDNAPVLESITAAELATDLEAVLSDGIVGAHSSAGASRDAGIVGAPRALGEHR